MIGSLTSSPSNGHHDLAPGGVGEQLLQPLLFVHEEGVRLQGRGDSSPCSESSTLVAGAKLVIQVSRVVATGEIVSRDCLLQELPTQEVSSTPGVCARP